MGSYERPNFIRVGLERGKTAENLVERVINDEISSGRAPQWLYGYERATRKDDRRGVDGWFKTDVGKIPVQIKSGVMGKEKFLEKRRNIPVVIVKIGLPDSTIYNKCISIVNAERKKHLEKRLRSASL